MSHHSSAHQTAVAPSTKTLKRVLGFGDLMGAAVGQIIGAGIMSLMGVAIAMTGRSAMISFIIAAVLILVNSLPSIIVAGTIRMRGGQYTQAALLGGTMFGGVVMFLSFFGNLSLAMYALSFADYFFRFVPGVPTKLVAGVVFTCFWGLNMFGVDKMAKVQNVIVLVMCAALALFAVFGVPKVQPGFFSEGFMTNGVLGVFQAAALLTFATGGAMVIVNLSGEAKNPVRDIPLAIIFSTVVVAALYGFLAFVAAGVLPVEQVAGKPLTQVAETALPPPLFVFFIVGGSMFALATTLNSQFASGTKPMLQGSVDGWLPRKLAYLHPRFKTPMAWLTIFYALGLVPIVTGLDIGEIANMVMIINQALMLVLNILLVRLPAVAPELWAQSNYRIGKKALLGVSVVSVFCGGVTIVLLISSSTPFLLAGNGVMLLFSFLYCYFRSKSGKVDMEMSYEAT
jgi:APA family basic amino acid/polyamine antiporter